MTAVLIGVGLLLYLARQKNGTTRTGDPQGVRTNPNAPNPVTPTAPAGEVTTGGGDPLPPLFFDPPQQVESTTVPPQTRSAYRVGQVFYYASMAHEVIVLGQGSLLTIGEGWIASGSQVKKLATGELFIVGGVSEAVLTPAVTAPSSGVPLQVLDPTTGYYVGGLSPTGIQLTGLEVYYNEFGGKYYIDSDGSQVYF